MPDASARILRLGHSPDPDDAFMWWPLLSIPGFSPTPCIDTGRFQFLSVAEDIESLNQRAAARSGASGESSATLLDITAISCAQYPFVQDRYALTACGSSMGDNYGPKLVARTAMQPADLKRGDVVVAVPGERTSAFAMTCIMLGRGSFRYTVVPFDQIIDAVAEGRSEVGLVIHEGQLTFQSAGLHLVEDLGRWWTARTGLPMPLGANVIRRDLEQIYGPGTLQEIAAILHRSVEYALQHRSKSIQYAMRFGRGLSEALADQFIAMYVNKWTLDFGLRGKEAVQRFFDEGFAAGLFPEVKNFETVASV